MLGVTCTVPLTDHVDIHGTSQPRDDSAKGAEHGLFFGAQRHRERRRVLSVGSGYLRASASEYMVASTSKYSSAGYRYSSRASLHTSRSPKAGSELLAAVGCSGKGD
jgi:hypothetical protein